MKELTIVLIPAEGDSAETEIWYLKKLKVHYRRMKYKLKVLVYEHGLDDDACDVALSTICRVREFVAKHDFWGAEVHAQGGLGAYVAYEFLCYCPERIARTFMVGGAPCEAMTGVAKVFHRGFVRLWYHIRWLVPFFADDPNPTDDEDIRKIKKSSTETMRANPLVYRNQLLFIGGWSIPSHWTIPEGCAVYFVPNGETVRPKLWDNTYDDDRAKDFWIGRGALVTERPGKNFSFYSMMPAEALFAVMDSAR